MVLTPSTMLPLGTPAPFFELPNALGGTVSLDDFRGRPFVVMFICNHCPYVKHMREGLAQFGRDCERMGVGVIAISANDAAKYLDDSPENMAVEARAQGYTFPYCHDESQAVATAYKAACTPDFYLFDSASKLVYRGQFDDSRPGNGKLVTGSDLRTAVAAVLKGEPVSDRQVPSVGCNIKWKPGNAPDYFG